ncbi:MAG: CoA transferase [Deltaproteobacteria bacterium]|nr:CoA transferase [Deltaproteobacteria bacterium]
MPFSRLTVVDVATLAAAPQIAAFFGDFGARVIKVEPPRGDPLRRLVTEDGVALQWKLVNRNKECVTLDLTDPAGLDVLHRLLGRADVLVSAHSLDRLVRFGIDAASLRERHPRLVAVNLTAWGIEGPWAERVGSGTLAEAAAGLAALTGEEDGPPGLSPVGLGDVLGVLQGVIAALLGLYARDASSSRGSRETGGEGELFDVAMYEPVLALLGARITQAARTGVDPGRHGNRFPTMAPRNAYATEDGEWVALTAGTDDLAHRTLAVIGRPELASDPRFATSRARVENAEALDRLVAEWIAARPCAEVVEAFQRERVSVAAIEGPLRVSRNPHFRARGSLVEMEDTEAGAMLLAAPLPRRSRDAGRVRHLGRALGADNASVYGGWLGLSADEIEALAASGMIGKK